MMELRPFHVVTLVIIPSAGFRFRLGDGLAQLAHR